MNKTVRYIVGTLATTAATVGAVVVYKRLGDPSCCGPTCECGHCKEAHAQGQEGKADVLRGGPKDIQEWRSDTSLAYCARAGVNVPRIPSVQPY